MSAAEEHVTAEERPLQDIGAINRIQKQLCRKDACATPGSPASSRHTACSSPARHRCSCTCMVTLPVLLAAFTKCNVAKSPTLNPSMKSHVALSPYVCRVVRSQDPWCKLSPSLKHLVTGAAEARVLELQQSLQDKSLRHEAEAARVAQERARQLSKLRQRHQTVDATKQQTSERRYGLSYLATNPVNAWQYRFAAADEQPYVPDVMVECLDNAFLM